jgi:superoxide reductase
MEKEEKYKCSVCGNIVEVKEVGGGTLVCCGKDMDLFIEEKTEVSNEDIHKTVFEIRGEKEIYVRIGDPIHPASQEHYIKWIEISVDGSLYVKSLNYWDKPEAVFRVPLGRKVTIRSLCNVDGINK